MPSLAPKCSESLTTSITHTAGCPIPFDVQTPPSLKLQAWGQHSEPGDMTADTCIRFVSAEL